MRYTHKFFMTRLRTMYSKLHDNVLTPVELRRSSDRSHCAANEHFTDGCIKLVRNGVACMCENDEATLHFRGVVILRVTQPSLYPSMRSSSAFCENGNHLRVTYSLVSACIRNFKPVFLSIFINF